MRYDRQRLLADIERGDLRPVYFFHGPEEYLKEQAVQDILKKMIPADLRPFNVDILYGDEVTAEEIVDRVATLPMGVQRRIVLVRNVHDLSIDERRKIWEYSVPAGKRKLLNELETKIMKNGRQIQTGLKEDDDRRKSLAQEIENLLGERKKIIDGLEYPFGHTCLVFTAEDGDAAQMFYHGVRKKRAKAEQSARPSAHSPAESRGKRSPTSAGEGPLFTPWLNDYIDQVLASVAFSSPKEKDVANWVHRLAKKYGKSIDDDAVQLLDKAVGMDLMALDNELAKLSCYVQERPEITSSDIEAVVGELQVRTVWNLCDAIVCGEMRQSMSLLSRLLEAGSTSPQIVGALRSRFSQLAQDRSWGGQRGISHLAESTLEQAYTSLYAAELQVNTGRQLPRIALTLLVCRLCQLFKGQPELDQGSFRPHRRWHRN